MRINSHAHLFPFRAVFTEETLSLLIDHLTLENWPDFAVRAVSKVLAKVIAGEMLDEDTLLTELVSTVKADAALKALVKQGSVRIQPAVALALNGNVANLPAGALREILGKVGGVLQRHNDRDTRTVDLGDLVAFLGIGVKSSIREVADKWVEYSGEDSLAVAVTLDVTRGGKADDALFQAQLRDTSLATLAYPGRILPFVAVNPARQGHFERMTGAIEHLGFVGISLYPNLGYAVDDKRLAPALEYCAEHDLPIIVHCSEAGFARDAASRRLADPAPWKAILTQYPDLRVCFSQFGGVENFVQPTIPEPSWTATILALMDEFPGVYADMANHDKCLDGGEREKNYFTHFSRLLSRRSTSDRILFGTGFYFVRQRVRDDNLWRFLESQLSKAAFQRLTGHNPARFLGLPGPTGEGGSPNIIRHLQFLARHNQEVTYPPLSWVERGIAHHMEPVVFYPNPFGTTWTRNNEAHFYTEQYFRSLMSRHAADRLTFTEKGHLRMCDLERWPCEALPKNIREKAVTALATGLQAFLTQCPKPGAVLEARTTSHAARKVLQGLFQNPDAKVASFGPAVDRLYRFNSEG